MLGYDGEAFLPPVPPGRPPNEAVPPGWFALAAHSSLVFWRAGPADSSEGEVECFAGAPPNHVDEDGGSCVSRAGRGSRREVEGGLGAQACKMPLRSPGGSTEYGLYCT